ncbi:dinitrogenase iron-molybdenum cofactor biosynthesis protein [Thermus sp. 2.9]|uniref:NifB/NifX family molybdenum-iron cluster-binding protein n=1 Tax=Thermus sp. (strain 2.9) TaxID=1577051 RepID=UPI000543763C|nr:NifB/NifX family molybdenum-iron cluster-binding protein [Thermus sp. 2.9]KHG64922.1 dinitrogenase iron-molybdenum cofactor biosynthesis protein [Thermus sp. 2.9]
MRVAIALGKEEGRVYPGPFGHAPRYAIYEAAEEGLRLVEVRENPHANEHGEEKHAKMRALLQDVDLKVGARFGHGGSLGAFPVAGRLEVGPVSLEEALALLMERRNSAG